MLATFVAMMTVSASPVEAVNLYREFKKGETLNYAVKAHMLVENIELGRSSIPSEIDFLYDFSIHVDDVDEGGFAHAIYKRPFITEIQGETAESPPISTKVPVDYHMELKLSPINEITDVKDLNPPKPDTRMAAHTPLVRTLMEAGVEPATALQLGDFHTELYRLALFIGSLDSALDFNPKLPLGDVTVGETWKKTVSYQPQTLRGSQDGEQAVQRLDMEYKYDGVVESGGKQVHRVTATVNLDTDAGKFINQLMGGTALQTGLKAFPLKLKSTITFDLDLQTKKTLRADARTEGGWEIEVTQLNRPIVKETILGRASMVLKP